MSSQISNKIKVPGGAFYAGDGLTVDPVTRTVSADGGGGDSNVTTLHIYISAIDQNNPTFTADKTPKEMLYVTTPTWCVMTFAAGLLGEKEVSLSVPPAWGAGAPSFGYLYDTIVENKNRYVVLGNTETNKWKVDLVFFGS
mgnify:CR=1 FL=1